MSQEADPEVVADLRLRSFTEHDRSRSRQAPVWIAPVIATEWPCRNPDCKHGPDGGRALIAVTDVAVERLAQFNQAMYEVAREHRPIRDREVAICATCAEVFNAWRSRSLDDQRYEMRKTIQAIKAHKSPRDADDLILKLKKLRHPDIQGLLQTLEDKQKLPGAKRATKGDV